MNVRSSTVFHLPENLSAKLDPALIARDEQQFDAIARSLEESITDLNQRLQEERRAPTRHGQEAMERDQQIHRLSSRLRTLQRYGVDLCLGRIVAAGNAEPVYVGRFGLSDGAGRQLLVDWRTPAAEPFFGATHAHPMGLISRRRYRWSRRRITDYWDEVFTTDGLRSRTALDDQSAFIASLSASRSSRMRDVLGTIAAEQDAVIRASSEGALIVDGGPGTGKTVVALHRSAYLLYADPRLGHHRGGLLVIGPHQPYLAYVADVLPSLGEEGVQTCTLRDLVPQGATATAETDPRVVSLKSTAGMVGAIETAVRFYEEPPATPLTVDTPWAEVTVTVADWADAFDAVEAGTPHNEAREQVWDQLLSRLTDRHGSDAPTDALRKALRGNADLVAAVHRAWPLIDAADLVGDLWTVPAYLRLCAPWLNRDDIAILQRPDPQAWTVSDLPLLDAARQRLGDPTAAAVQRRREQDVASRRDEMTHIARHLIESDDSEMAVMSMLRGEDLQNSLIDEDILPTTSPDLLAGPFAHIVVDEAQELTDAQWQMVLQRCPSRSLTIVGDRAQARHGFAETWAERLHRIGIDRMTQATLSINYRTPQEVMAEAEPVIRAALPDANVPTSIRASGIPVVHGTVADLDTVLQSWLADHDDGIACVIGEFDAAPVMHTATERVRLLTPELAKGLEFDLVIVLDPAGFGPGIEGAVDRYVAMTRTTQQLVILTTERRMPT